MCGACMPSCPTYQTSQDENFSPRGRISLVQAVTQNKLTLSDNVISHFDSCLQCFNCQTICPSQVKYSEIISYIMEQSFSHRKLKWFSLSFFTVQISNVILVNKTFRKYFIIFINFLIHNNLLQFIKHFALKFNLKSISLLPDKQIKLSDKTLKQKFSDNISIFTGCATSLFDSQLVSQTCQLFELLQVSVTHVDSENCCGAIYQKQGNRKALNKLQDNAINNQSYNNTLISINSACSAYMKNSSTHKNNCIEDIVTVLANKFWDRLKNIQFAPFPNNILFHQSCSMRNTLKNQSDCFKLLKLIPHIKVTLFPQTSCCGASGNYMLSHAKLAEKIVNPYIEFIIKENIHFMVSTDISCSLHIKQQLERQNYHFEVLHPISLLHQQII